MRDYNQPGGSRDDSQGADAEMLETQPLSPEQTHAQARENYQQAKSSLVETRDGRYWLSRLRWNSTETTGHVMVGVSANTVPEETHQAGQDFFQAKMNLVESFGGLSMEDQAEMRPDIKIGEPESGFDRSHVIDLNQLANIADAHHALIHFRHQIGSRRTAAGSGESLGLAETDYAEIGRVWVAEQYLGEAARGIDSELARADMEKNRMREIAAELNQAQRRAVDVGDQDVEIGFHELKNRLVATNDEWGGLLVWEP